VAGGTVVVVDDVVVVEDVVPSVGGGTVVVVVDDVVVVEVVPLGVGSVVVVVVVDDGTRPTGGGPPAEDCPGAGTPWGGEGTPQLLRTEVAAFVIASA
jgi:hypothetical protein